MRNRCNPLQTIVGIFFFGVIGLAGFMHQSVTVSESDSWVLESELGSDWQVEVNSADWADDPCDYFGDNSLGNVSSRIMLTMVTRDQTVVVAHLHTSFIRGPPA